MEPILIQSPRSLGPVSCEPPIAYDKPFERVVSNHRLQLLYDRGIWCEGPAWWEKHQTLVFSDVRGRRTLGWRTDGSVRILDDRSNFANGNAIDHRGDLIRCEHGGRRVVRWRKNKVDVLADRYAGKHLNSPNDLLVARDGAVWFTDPTFGIEDPREGYPATPELSHTSVYRWSEQGGLQRMTDVDQPNGIAFSPDESRLYVTQTPTDGRPPEIAVYDWDRNALRNRQTFARVPDGQADGIAVDARGWLWASSGSGVVVYDPSGKLIGKIPTPHLTSNCTFDTTQSRLFITGREALWMIRLAA